MLFCFPSIFPISIARIINNMTGGKSTMSERDIRTKNTQATEKQLSQELEKMSQLS